MSQHRSLRPQDKDKQQRSVLKRYERIRDLEKKDKWADGDSVFGLPKLKIVKFKIKKEKAAPTEGAEGAEGAVTAEGAAGATGAKAGAPAKGGSAPGGKPGAKPAAGAAKEAPKKDDKKKK